MERVLLGTEGMKGKPQRVEKDEVGDGTKMCDLQLSMPVVVAVTVALRGGAQEEFDCLIDSELPVDPNTSQ